MLTTFDWHWKSIISWKEEENDQFVAIAMRLYTHTLQQKA